jgi:hypothetical protein
LLVARGQAARGGDALTRSFQALKPYASDG